MNAAVENVLTVAGVAAVGIVVVLVCSCVLSVCGLLGRFSRCARTRDVLDLEAQTHLARQSGDIARLDQLEAQLRDLKQGSG